MATSAGHQQEPVPARAHQPARRTPSAPAPDGILAMQRRAGNQAVTAALAPAGGTIEMRVPARDHRTVAMMHAADVRARLPTFADLRAAMTDPKLRIPEDVIKTAVTQLLGRMAGENRLKSKDPVATIVTKIFPGPGRINEAEFNNAVDPADRTQIYQTVLDANTTVKTVDQARLKTLMTDAWDLMNKAGADVAGCTAVFGTQAAEARARYTSGRNALAAVAADLDKHVTTDYNLDDEETFLGGWANFNAKHMHLLIGVVKGIDPKDSKITLIHESSHLGNGAVDDLGYYGTPGFEAMTDTEKVNNAAHYEELPRRALGISSYPGITFTPGTLSGGGAVTDLDRIRKIASDYMQKAWDAASDAHMWLRGVRKVWLTKKDTAPFTAEKPLILELSRLSDMTVHHQDPAHAQITTLDVTIIESVVRAMGLISGNVGGEPLPVGPYTDQGAAHVMVEEATKKYGQLLGDPTRDMALVDWLSTHFRMLPAAP